MKQPLSARLDKARSDPAARLLYFVKRRWALFSSLIVVFCATGGIAYYLMGWGSQTINVRNPANFVRLTEESRANLAPKLRSLMGGGDPLRYGGGVLSFSDVRPKLNGAPDKFFYQPIAYDCDTNGPQQHCSLNQLFTAALATSGARHEFMYWKYGTSWNTQSPHLGFVCTDQASYFIFDLSTIPHQYDYRESYALSLDPGMGDERIKLSPFGAGTRTFVVDNALFEDKITPNATSQFMIYSMPPKGVSERFNAAPFATIAIDRPLLRRDDFCNIQRKESVATADPGGLDRNILDGYKAEDKRVAEVKERAKKQNLESAQRLIPHFDRLRPVYEPYYKRIDAYLAKYGFCNRGVADNPRVLCDELRAGDFDGKKAGDSEGRYFRLYSKDKQAEALFSFGPHVTLISGGENFVSAVLWFYGRSGVVGRSFLDSNIDPAFRTALSDLLATIDIDPSLIAECDSSTSGLRRAQHDIACFPHRAASPNDHPSLKIGMKIDGFRTQ